MVQATETVELDQRVRFVDVTSRQTWQLVLPVSDGTTGWTPPPAFKGDVQIALVTAGERYLVSLPHRRIDAVLEDALAAIAAAEGATAVLVEADKPGHAVARILGTADATHAAMAVAVVKYSWAWDEAEEIVIEIGTLRHAVRVLHAGPTFAFTVQATRR